MTLLIAGCTFIMGMLVGAILLIWVLNDAAGPKW